MHAGEEGPSRGLPSDDYAWSLPSHSTQHDFERDSKLPSSTREFKPERSQFELADRDQQRGDNTQRHAGHTPEGATRGGSDHYASGSWRAPPAPSQYKCSPSEGARAKADKVENGSAFDPSAHHTKRKRDVTAHEGELPIPKQKPTPPHVPAVKGKKTKLYCRHVKNQSSNVQVPARTHP